ncbi:MAG: hypothetical protein HN704_07065 [Bacteroidetes bacterium]|mgnify:CR=1 FL=1|jgi:ankyrin repeat protein|nr:hypothetical protein [Bacteroidota bacterium]MBT6686504.1 hypothetical protein [Bacteroidota bacterium]MBT7144237.1 hypothetical protein [Bacteroidota bacterium]MBT7491347.1 hypothetical protein [Bacteroidota bacterium]
MKAFCLIVFYCTISYFSTSYAQDTTDSGFELLEYAYEGNFKKVDSLLKQGTDANSCTYKGYTAIMYAAENGNIDIAKLLIENGADVNMVPFNKTSPLIAATKNNFIEICELLIRNNAEVNCIDRKRASPLFYAAAYGYDTLCDMLIYYGAVDYKNFYNQTSPLMIASFVGNIEIVDLLLHHGALLSLKDKKGRTALFYAIESNQFQIVELLINNSANIFDTTKSGISPIILAANQGNFEILEMLLDKHSAVYINSKSEDQKVQYDSIMKDSELNLALFYAKLNKHRNIEKLLKKYNVQNKKLIISNFSIHIDNYFNTQDYMFGGGFGFYELKSNSTLNFGFNSRLRKKSILMEQDTNLFFQFREQRFLFYSSFEKQLNFINTNELETGFLLGIKGLFTFGNLRGTKLNVKNKFHFVPQVGYFFKKGDISYKIYYEYLDFNIYEFSPHRINISLAANIRLKKLNYKKANFDWLY